MTCAQNQRQSLSHLRRKARRAAASLGGVDALAERLHALLAGNGGPGGAGARGASLAEFHAAVGDAYNLRWRLLSEAIDRTCRWVFVAAYVVGVVTTAVTLVTRPLPAAAGGARG